MPDFTAVLYVKNMLVVCSKYIVKSERSKKKHESGNFFIKFFCIMAVHKLNVQ